MDCRRPVCSLCPRFSFSKNRCIKCSETRTNRDRRLEASGQILPEQRARHAFLASAVHEVAGDSPPVAACRLMHALCLSFPYLGTLPALSPGFAPYHRETTDWIPGGVVIPNDADIAKWFATASTQAPSEEDLPGLKATHAWTFEEGSTRTMRDGRYATVAVLRDGEPAYWDERFDAWWPRRRDNTEVFNSRTLARMATLAQLPSVTPPHHFSAPTER